MKVDDVITKLGDLGRYQLLYYTLVCLPIIWSGMNSFGPVFLLGEPEYRCSINDNDTTYIPATNETAALVDAWIPRKKKDQSKYQSCKMYVNDSSSFPNVSETRGCSRYLFSKEFFTSTAVSEFTLVCDDSYLNSLSTSLYMIGGLGGALAGGIASDTLGRKKAFLGSCFIDAIFGTIQSFAPEFWSFTIFRMGLAFGDTSMYIAGFVLGLEIVGPSKRMAAGVFVAMFFALGVVVLTPLAYFIREWRTLALVMGASQFIFIPYIWILPESLHWLLSSKKIAEAQAIIDKASRMNRVTLPDNILQKVEEEQEEKQEPLVAIFKAKTLLLKTLIIFFNWIIISMGYYTFTLNSGTYGDIYISYLLSGLVEFPAYGICLLCGLLGRKFLHVGGMVVGGVSSIIIVILIMLVDQDSYQWAFTLMDTIAKFGVTVGFCVIYFWAAEIFPTPLRTTLIGLSSTVSTIGAFAAPYMADMAAFIPGKLGLTFPPILTGVGLIISAGLSLLLPETTNRPFPETIEEANKWHVAPIQPISEATNITKNDGFVEPPHESSIISRDCTVKQTPTEDGNKDQLSRSQNTQGYGALYPAAEDQSSL